jgi:hypothetical protein
MNTWSSGEIRRFPLDFGSETGNDERMNRLLSKIRHSPKPAGANGDGVKLVRVVPGRASARRSSYVLTAAETAACTCPDFCERDHGNE